MSQELEMLSRRVNPRLATLSDNFEFVGKVKWRKSPPVSGLVITPE
jgi:hypothetical protein